MSKKCVVGIFILIFAVGRNGIAQSEHLPELWLTTNKTTVIVSHFKIRSVDRGTRDVLVQRVPGGDTILELKAARAGFPETNLTILTADGVIHMFMVRFSVSPQVLPYPIDVDGNGSNDSRPNEVAEDLNEAGFERLADSIILRQVDRVGRPSKSVGTKAIVAGIFIHEEALLFRFKVKNRSSIPYDVGQMNFYIEDRSQAKRTASQQIAETPIYFKGDCQHIEGKSKVEFVVAFRKFTIPDKKVLYLVIKERDGGRLLRLRVTSKELMKAETI